VGVVAELTEDPGAEYGTDAGQAQVAFSVPVPTKMLGHHLRVNMLGYIADNLACGSVRSAQWYELDALVAAGAGLLDVRTAEEYAAGHIPGAVNVPLDGLYQRRADLPAGPLVVYCQAGQRAHTAASLIGDPDRVVNLDGGYLTWLTGQPAT
jgi:rhodanese-related sulfurtransferase